MNGHCYLNRLYGPNDPGLYRKPIDCIDRLNVEIFLTLFTAPLSASFGVIPSKSCVSGHGFERVAIVKALDYSCLQRPTTQVLVTSTCMRNFVLFCLLCRCVDTGALRSGNAYCVYEHEQTLHSGATLRLRPHFTQHLQNVSSESGSWVVLKEFNSLSTCLDLFLHIFSHSFRKR